MKIAAKCEAAAGFGLPGILSVAVAVILAGGCGFWPAQNVGLAALPEYDRLPLQSIRVDILSKQAPRRLDLLLTDGRLFANGETIAPGGSAKQARIRVELELLPAAIRVRISGGASNSRVRTLESESIIIDSNEIYELGFAERPRRKYRGRLEVFAQQSPDRPGRRDRLAAVVHVPLELYVQSTARAELGPLLSRDGATALPESGRSALLTAMEAVVRSYALAHRNRHSNPGATGGEAIAPADLCDLTHCMHFPGLVSAGQQVTGGPAEDARLILLLEDVVVRPDTPPGTGEIVPAYFHSTCGGRLIGPNAYWRKIPKRRELTGVFREGHDEINGRALCAESPHYRWRTRVDVADLNKILALPDSQRPPQSFSIDPDPDSGPVEGIKTRAGVAAHARATTLAPLHRVGGRVVRMRAGKRDEQTAADFLSRAGRVLGWHAIKSSDFTVADAPDGSLNFRGRGLGHGVGFCQWGAWEQARQGRSALEILKFYYPGARIARVKQASP